ncbi:MarR family winged helix-turn-helix transcriptional regulator [Actinophytocola sp. NPDC049390]|uniref:MarR family winged helix-turn-helix transcriptional regulator n=1 Tax=Actinophytocola sp. NPDC049390 TaxID=3363894 RepID=UPI0037B63722
MTQPMAANDGTDEALAVLRAMVAIADSTVESVVEQLTLTQFRTLRTVAERTPVTMSAVAHELAINPSTVTRAGEKLVALGLLQRARNPLNKRETLLAPTAEGRRIVEQVDTDRRQILSSIMRRLDEGTRTAVAAAFEHFVAAAATVPPSTVVEQSKV